MTHKIKATIEFADNNCTIYLNDIDGIIGVGETIEQAKDSLRESIQLTVQTCMEEGIEIPTPLAEDYEIQYTCDLSTFLQAYSRILSKAGLEKLTGINQKQLHHYASGHSRPRPQTTAKVEKAVHTFANELTALSFA